MALIIMKFGCRWPRLDIRAAPWFMLFLGDKDEDITDVFNVIKNTENRILKIMKENKNFGNLKHKKPHKVAFYRIDEPELRIWTINAFYTYFRSAGIGNTELLSCAIR